MNDDHLIALPSTETTEGFRGYGPFLHESVPYPFRAYIDAARTALDHRDRWWLDGKDPEIRNSSVSCHLTFPPLALRGFKPFTHLCQAIRYLGHARLDR